MSAAESHGSASRRAEEPALEAQKRSFLRMMSHELRTPLNSILGFSEILATELYGPLGSPHYKEYAEIIRQSGDKLLRLVNQLVEMARLDAGAVAWEFGSEPLGPAIEQALAGFADELAARRVSVRVDGDAPCVRADPRGVKTILSGLIHNAILYSPEGSQVRIAAALSGQSVELTVENATQGLQPEDLPRLMKPFEQGESALTRHAEGAGLGLPICALTARAMGGQLRLEARKAGRLAAIVTLPAA